MSAPAASRTFTASIELVRVANAKAGGPAAQVLLFADPLLWLLCAARRLPRLRRRGLTRSRLALRQARNLFRCRAGGRGGKRPVRSPGIVGLAQVRGPAARGGIRPDVEIRAAIDEQLHGGRMALVRSPHQRRRAPQRFLGIDLRSAIEQHLHRRHVARAGRHHQGRLPPRQCLVRVRASLQEAFHDRGVAIHARQRERGRALLIGHLGIGAGLKQQVGQGGVAPIHRPVKRRRPVRLRGVHVGLLSEQGADGRRVSSHDRVGHLTTGRTQGRHRLQGQQQHDKFPNSYSQTSTPSTYSGRPVPRRLIRPGHIYSGCRLPSLLPRRRCLLLLAVCWSCWSVPARPALRVLRRRRFR